MCYYSFFFFEFILLGVIQECNAVFLAAPFTLKYSTKVPVVHIIFMRHSGEMKVIEVKL